MTKRKVVLMAGIGLLTLATVGFIADFIPGRSSVDGTDYQAKGLPRVDTIESKPNIKVMKPAKPSTVLWEEKKSALPLSDDQPTLSELDISEYDEQVIDKSEQQIQVLIQEYNRHLGDREARENIENEVAHLAQNYKQSVLRKINQLNNLPQ